MTLSVRPTLKGDVRRGDHAPCDCFAVQQLFVARLAFKGVTDGMAEVQDAPQPAFLLVRGYNLRLQLYRLRDEPLQFDWIAFQNAGAILLEAQEQLDAADDSALKCFVQSSAKLTIR